MKKEWIIIKNRIKILLMFLFIIISLSICLYSIYQANSFLLLRFEELIILSKSSKNYKSLSINTMQQEVFLWATLKQDNGLLPNECNSSLLISINKLQLRQSLHLSRYLLLLINDFFIEMENKQLERQLKAIVQNLKGEETQRVIQSLEKDHNIFLHKNFTKSGINCTCCTLTHQKFIATGFGRNQQEALINATKNFMETLIATNTFVTELRTAIRYRDGKVTEALPTKNTQKNEDTIVLEAKDLADMSAIQTERGGCNCVYFQVHQHHLSEIKNMQARMKLIMKQNQMLKELLLKDVQKERNKENYGWKANFN